MAAQQARGVGIARGHPERSPASGERFFVYGLRRGGIPDALLGWGLEGAGVRPTIEQLDNW